jgi:membrane-associated phospholipid phosphatase
VLAAVASWAILPRLQGPDLPDFVRALLPLPVLLGGYWLSGAFFVRPMVHVEAALRRWDTTLIDGSGIGRRYRGAHAAVRDAFELAYLMAYPMVPLGALTLVAGGRADHLDTFWATVLLAAFLAYGALPWIQTRPPRSLERSADRAPAATPVRRLNELVLGRASVQANTIPSGHAAAALAVALGVAGAMPVAGALLGVLALLIALATVLGEYHYAIDTMLGVLVAAVATALVALTG